MARLYSNRERSFDLGVLPTELLPRDAAARVLDARQPQDDASAGPDSILAAIPEYRELFAKYLDGAGAPARAPVPEDLAKRSQNLKASAFFLDVTLAGVCRIAPEDWSAEEHPAHSHAFVVLIEFGRETKKNEAGDDWIRGTNAARTDLRCAEVAVVMAGYIRALGWQARGHVAGHSLVSIERLAQCAGVAKCVDGTLAAPMLKRGFRLGVVTTDYALQPDAPLASLDWPGTDAYTGTLGTRPGWTEAEEDQRPLHLGRYEMEKIKRVDEPTTLVLRDEIKRMPKRADLFSRALAGDLGERPARERRRFAVKHPLAFAMTPLIRNMVPLQGGREPLAGSNLGDAKRNAEAIKALGYYMGADLVGICRAEPWMYYSHGDEAGEPIEPYHPYAVVMLIDQGFETMEGSSGDDWVSATMPLLTSPDGMDEVFKALVEQFVRGAEWVADVLRGRVKDVLLGHSDAVRDLSFVPAHFWRETEGAFYNHARRLRDGLAIPGSEMPITESWLSAMRAAALSVFDHYSQAGDFDALNPRKVAIARNDLFMALTGKKLRSLLGLPAPNRKVA